MMIHPSRFLRVVIALFAFLAVNFIATLSEAAAKTAVTSCTKENLSAALQADFPQLDDNYNPLAHPTPLPYGHGLVKVKDFGFYSDHICWSHVSPLNNPNLLYSVKADASSNVEMNSYSDFVCKVFETGKNRNIPVEINFTHYVCSNAKSEPVSNYLSVNFAGISAPSFNPHGNFLKLQKQLRASNSFQSENVGIIFNEASRFQWVGVESSEMGKSGQEAYMVFGVSLNGDRYSNNILYYDSSNPPSSFSSYLPTESEGMNRFEKILDSMLNHPMTLGLQGVFTTLTNAPQNTRSNTVVITQVEDI